MRHKRCLGRRDSRASRGLSLTLQAFEGPAIPSGRPDGIVGSWTEAVTSVCACSVQGRCRILEHDTPPRAAANSLLRPSDNSRTRNQKSPTRQYSEYSRSAMSAASARNNFSVAVPCNTCGDCTSISQLTLGACNANSAHEIVSSIRTRPVLSSPSLDI